ncbi:MAG TPA: hypothetical protein VGF69_12905 [Thermoanaerobaculia bacterium]|jgi:hypothetical protein
MHQLAAALLLLTQVTIPLDQYDQLRRTSESPSTTVVDTILVSGSFAERTLAIAFRGRSTGTRPAVRAMEQANDVTISGCTGNGIVSRAGKGTFDVIPLAETFDVKCELRISGSDRLRAHVPAGVLALRSTVTDGELVVGDEDNAGARDVTLVRHVAGSDQVLSATATGRYLITLLPDATRFRYAVDVHNPNRTTSTLNVGLQSNEHLQQIDSAASYEVNGAQYIFSIPPGDSTITMTGELRGTSFVAPVKASLQYVVIESHPLLRPKVDTAAKRISLGETGVTPQYRGAVAFETGSERIGWQVTRLQALHAISYAVTAAQHTFFIPVDGPVLGESQFDVRNQGAAELVLPPKPEPTYVSLGDEPVLMTKNAAGGLTVPLSQGEQSVLAQHRQTLGRTLGFTGGTITIPQLDVAATQTTLALRYPDEWLPLYQSFASGARVAMPTAGQLLLFLFLVVWIERMLAWTGVPLRRRLAIALLAALGASIVTTFLAATVLFFLCLTAVWVWSQSGTRRLVLLLSGGALLFIVAFAMFLGTNVASKNEYGYESSTAVTREAPAAADVTKVARVDQQPSYQGLPAKFTLPNGERHTFFSQELLQAGKPQTARIVAVSLSLVNWIGAAIALAAIVLLWRERASLAATLRHHFTKRVDEPVTA